MRVVVVHPARKEEDGTEVPESIAAYRLGRIEDLSDPLTGETTPAAKVAEILTEQAQAEFPGCAVRTEYLHVLTRDPDTGEVQTSEWLDHAPEDAPPPPPGENQAVEITATQTQEVGQ